MKSPAEVLVNGQVMDSGDPAAASLKWGRVHQEPMSTFRYTKGVVEQGHSKNTPGVSGREVMGSQYSAYC